MWRVWCEDCDEVLLKVEGSKNANKWARRHEERTCHICSFAEHTPWEEQEGVEDREAIL